MSALELDVLECSTRMWKRVHGPTTLYCDTPWARLLEAVGLLSLFDEVNTDTLDQLGALPLDPSVFWTYGRLISWRAMTTPFVSVDADLIVWRSLESLLESSDLVFTHWEDASDSPWYPDAAVLARPGGFARSLERFYTPRAANASLVFFGRRELKERYLEEAFAFLAGNRARKRPDLGAAPEQLFVDQRLLPAIALEVRATIGAVIPDTWIPAEDRFRSEAGHVTWDPLSVEDQPHGVTHLWFFKRELSSSNLRLQRLAREIIAALELLRHE